jgi:hypothetical protein
VLIYVICRISPYDSESEQAVHSELQRPQIYQMTANPDDNRPLGSSTRADLHTPCVLVVL